MRSLVFALLLLLVVPCAAQFQLPDLPGLPGGGGIPGLDSILKEDPPLTTSFKDAITGVRYYDDFSPRLDVAMAEMPRGPRHSFMLAPGGYEVILQSYCLCAGTHGPGRGEGYQYAPLKGPVASVISDVLDHAADHPDIPQHDVQSLVWGIESKTKISEMPAELQRAAARLLQPAQIDKLNGGALGKVPPELINQTFVRVPPVLRQMMEARATLRNMLSAATPDFGALEQVAVLAGDPPDEKGEDVPRERWSYRSGGFFVRYDPSGYDRTRVQVFIPQDVQVVRDDKGRIVGLADVAGNRVEAEYDDRVAPATISGDNAVTGYAFSRLRFIRPVPGAAGKTEQVEATGRGWVLVGVPSGKGKPAAGSDRFADLKERYTAAVAHRTDLVKLAANVRKVGEKPAPPQVADEIVGGMVDLASFATGVKAALDETLAARRWVARAADLPRVAWGLGLVYIGEGGAATTEVGQARPAWDGTRLAAQLYDGGRLAFSSAAPARIGSPGPWGPSPSRRRLKSFDSSGSATPANTGRQRLGLSPRADDDQEDAGEPDRDNEEQPDEQKPEEEQGSDKSILDRARNAIDWIGKGMDAVNFITDPAGTIAGKIGSGVQDRMQDAYFDWVFDTTAKISTALGGDPPRPDFNIIATAEPLPAAGQTPQWGNVPPARAAALTALRTSMLDLLSHLQAGQISVDRLGGALQANDAQWIARQSEALLFHKRQSGAAMIVAADRLDALVAALEAEGITEVRLTPEAYRKYQDELRQGLSAEQLAAVQALGLSEAEIEAGRQQRLAVDPNELDGDMIEQAQATARAMRALGHRWWRLPEGAGLEE